MRLVDWQCESTAPSKNLTREMCVRLLTHDADPLGGRFLFLPCLLSCFLRGLFPFKFILFIRLLNGFAFRLSFLLDYQPHKAETRSDVFSVVSSTVPGSRSALQYLLNK